MYFIEFGSSNGIDILPILIDSVYILIIIVFFMLTRSHDRKVRDYERKSIWYKELIILPHISLIDKFFDQLKGLMESGTKIINEIKQNQKPQEQLTNALRDLIRVSNSHLSTFRKDFIDIIYAMDSDFAKDLFEILNNLQDDLNNRIEEIETANEKSFDDIIREGRINLYKKIFHNQFLEIEGFTSYFTKRKK